MQWLRHTRPDPPTIAEQQHDLRRRETIKLLAARADQRWAEKPSALDAPDKQQPIQVLESRDPKAGLAQSNVQLASDKTGATETAAPLSRPSEQLTSPQQPATPQQQQQQQQTVPPRPQPKKQKARKDPKDSPWNKTSQGVNPGDDWQPKGWTPAPAARKRS
jgi:NADH dehydrogenase [ubiquinone] 1 alpha subcomplex assembly factor 2